MRGTVWIGDLARALAAIDGFGDEGKERAVARLLTAQPPVVPAGRRKETVLGETAIPRQAAIGVPVPAEAEEAAPEVPLLQPAGHEPTPMPGWSVAPLPRPDPGLLALPPRHVPLFPPRSTARLLQAALSRRVLEGRLDVTKLVDQIAGRRPVTALPREPVQTLRFGAQVLVDLGIGMEPFARDQEDVLRHIRATVGAENTKVVYFEDCPLRGAGHGPPRTWRAYRAPAPGTRVLVLSDLGLGGLGDDPHSSTRNEWEEFARTVRRHECEPIAFVPLPQSRWPRWAAAAMGLISWDRGTTAAEVAAILR